MIEVQQEKSDAKLRQLPRYAAALWPSPRCPVTVLCICPDAGAASWYAEPIRTELPGFVFRAAVLGPREVPAITDPEEAAIRPELAALAVMAHGRDRRVVETFMAAPAVQRILDESRAEGEANALLRVLAVRGIEVPEDVRARIRACTDARKLETWPERAVGAKTIADLFE